MSDNQKNTITIFQNLLRANATVHCYRTVQQLGIINLLKSGQKSSEEIAGELDLQQAPLEMLLDQLVETGFIEKYDEDYALSVIAKMLPEELADLGDSYQQHLQEWIQTGNGLVKSGSEFETTPFGMEKQAFEWMNTPNAMDLIEILNIGKSRIGMKIIQLAPGSGIFGCAMAYHDQKVKITFVDTAANLTRCRETAASVNILDRCQFIEADPVSFQPKFSVDLILVCNHLNLLGDSDLQRQIQSIQVGLKKNGEVAVVDRFLDSPGCRFDNRTHAIELAMRTTDGKCRSIQEYKTLLESNGFCDILYSSLKSPPATEGVLVAGLS